jgi:hypothetical protein
MPGGNGVQDLEETVRRLAEGKTWDVNAPLPTTRELGDHFRVSNASACRVLKRLDGEKVIWRRDNGRYYFNESRRLYERRKPYACLLRKLQNWSRIYQGIMSGFSERFGRDRASLLYIHDDHLVRHTDTALPPVHADAAVQREALTEFFRDHRQEFAGILLDDVWLDEVLEQFESQLTNAVIVCRTTRIRGISSVAPDFDQGALLALGHLYARGYEEVWLAIPFSNAVPVDLMADAVVRAGKQLGRPVPAQARISVATPADREKFIARVRQSDRRIGIFCLEDNICVRLHEDLERAGIRSPEHVGILSGMGTEIVTGRGISSIRIDFDRIGATAGELLLNNDHRVVTLPTQLAVAGTT